MVAMLRVHIRLRDLPPQVPSPAMRDSVTPKQVAQAIGVSESSVKRWCDAGRLAVELTAGGHRRIRLDSILKFLAGQGFQLVSPESIGLPSNTGRTGSVALPRAAEFLTEALCRGDEESSRRVVLDLVVAGYDFASVADQVISEAMGNIGHHWEVGRLEIYQERLACQILVRVFADVFLLLARPPSHAPKAIGAALSGDTYDLPTQVVELALREVGVDATSLGTNLPPQSFVAALAHHRPRLAWISVSWVADLQEFAAGLAAIKAAAKPLGTTIVVGGQCLRREAVRAALPSGTKVLKSVRDLVRYWEGMQAGMPRPSATDRPRSQRPRGGIKGS